MVALAVELLARGVEVRMCAPPDPDLSGLVDRAGVPLVPFGRAWRSWPGPPSAGERRQRVSDFIEAQHDTLGEAAVGCDVVVATAMSQFVAPSVAELLGVPYHYALFCPDVLDGLDGRGFDELFGAPLDDHRASVGLPPAGAVGRHLFTDRPLLAADPVLGPWRGQDGFDVLQTGAWILPDARPLPAELVTFLDDGDPPVYVGFGSMRTVDGNHARTTIEAARGQGRRVLVGRGWAGLGSIDDRDDCLGVGEVNQQALFRRVAAVLHHGGAGTTTAAARAGVPQVVVPQAGDQVYWASRVATLGVGAAHDEQPPTVASLSAALASALSPGTRGRASAVAAALRPDGAAVAADLLLEGHAP